MPPKRYCSKLENLAEPEYGRTKKIHIWEHGDIYSKCYETYINPNQLRTWNSILSYLTKMINPCFGAVYKLVSIKTKKCVNCFKDLENNGRYIAVGSIKRITFAESRYKTDSELDMEQQTKRDVKRFYSGEIDSAEFRFLTETKKRNLTIIFVLVSGLECQTPSKVVLTGADLQAWDVILAYLATILDVPNGIQHISTIYGDLILDPTELQHGYVYVVIPHNEKFVEMDYMKFFNEWEDSAKKKGMVMSIRPASKRKVVPHKRSKKRKTLLTNGNGSPPITDTTNTEPFVVYTGEFGQNPAGGETIKETSQLPPNVTSTGTQTACIIQDNTLTIGSQIYILINVEEYNKRKELYPSFEEPKFIFGSEPNGGSSKALDDTTKSTMIYTLQTEPSVIDDTKNNNITATSKNGEYKKENNNNNNKDFISITIIISKTSKMSGKSEKSQNTALNRRYEARTYCSNVELSGTFSDRIKNITRIIHNAIIDTYERLLQTISNVNNIDVLQPLSNPNKNDVMNQSKLHVIKRKTDGQETTTENSMSSSDSDTYRPVETRKSETVTYEISKTQQVSHCQENNHAGTIARPPIQIQNKTYINFCGLKMRKRDSQDAAGSGYSDKQTIFNSNAACKVKTVGGKQQGCCFCGLSSIPERQQTDNKLDPIVKHKMLHKSTSHRPGAVKKELSNTIQPGGSVLITSHSYSSSDAYVDKGAESTVSLDSISGAGMAETDKSAEALESPLMDHKSIMPVRTVSFNTASVGNDTSNTAADTEQSQRVDDNKDEISITVNVTKVNGLPESQQESVKASDFVKQELNEYQALEATPAVGNLGEDVIHSSNRILSGSFNEKRDDLKDVIGDILTNTYEAISDVNKTESVNDVPDPKTDDSQMKQKKDDSMDMVQNDHTERKSLGIVIEKSRDQQNASETKTATVPSTLSLKKCRNASNYKAIPKEEADTHLCENIAQKRKGCKRGLNDKSIKSIVEFEEYECLCQSGRKEATGCCICSHADKEKDSEEQDTDVSSNERIAKSQSRTNKITETRDSVKQTVSKSIKSMNYEQKPGNSESLENNEYDGASTAKNVNVSSTATTDIERNEGQGNEGSFNKPGSELFASDSDISVDSIEDVECCVCLCSSKYIKKPNATKPRRKRT